MKKNIMTALVLALICCAAASLQAQNHSLSGRVTWKKGIVSLNTDEANQMDGKPVVGAKVRIGPGNYTATTDENGYYTIPNVPEGTYTMHVKAQEHSSTTKVVVVNEQNETLDVKLVWRNVKLGKANRDVGG